MILGPLGLWAALAHPWGQGREAKIQILESGQPLHWRPPQVTGGIASPQEGGWPGKPTRFQMTLHFPPCRSGIKGIPLKARGEAVLDTTLEALTALWCLE